MAGLGLCAAFGDPHFITFDGAHTVFVGARVFWLVKSKNVWVQGLSQDSEGKLMGVAIGGPFLRGHELLLRRAEGPTLMATFDGSAILRQATDEFRVPELLEAVRSEEWRAGLHNDDILGLRTERQFSTGPWPERFVGRPRGGVFLLRLPEGVEVTATGVDYMSVVVTMGPQAGGQGGYCGDFDGSADNDMEPVAPSWNRPAGPGLGPVPKAQSLFGKLPPMAGGSGPSIDQQATLESALDPRLCAPELRELAERYCSRIADVRMRQDCVFDACRAGSAEVAEDALAAEVLEQKVNSRGIPAFVGQGRCLDAQGWPYAAFDTRLTAERECLDALRSLAAVAGVAGAELGGQPPSCRVLVFGGADPRGSPVQGGWGPRAPTAAGGAGEGHGLVSDASGEAGWRCWQLA